MDKNSDSGSNVRVAGIGVASAFVLLFVALRLTGYIDWSWWWIFAPWWGGAAVTIVILLIVLVFVFFVGS